MSSIECANEFGDVSLETEPAPPVSDLAAKLRTRIFYGFGGTMALGLSLAGWYVGGRILAAEQTPPTATAAPAQIVNQPVQVSVVRQEVAEHPPAPRVPEKFLEVAGLSAKQDALFVKKLRAKGLPARIQIGELADSRRILIGPLVDQPAVERAQRKLQVDGILALERSY